MYPSCARPVFSDILLNIYTFIVMQGQDLDNYTLYARTLVYVICIVEQSNPLHPYNRVVGFMAGARYPLCRYLRFNHRRRNKKGGIESAKIGNVTLGILECCIFFLRVFIHVNMSVCDGQALLCVFNRQRRVSTR